MLLIIKFPTRYKSFIMFIVYCICIFSVFHIHSNSVSILHVIIVHYTNYIVMSLFNPHSRRVSVIKGYLSLNVVLESPLTLLKAPELNLSLSK